MASPHSLDTSSPPGQEQPILTWYRGMARVTLTPTGEGTAVVQAATQWSEQPHHYGDVAAVDGTYVAAWTAAGLNYLGPEWCADRSEEIDAAMTEWSR